MQERYNIMCRLTPVQTEILMLAGLFEIPIPPSESPDDVYWALIKNGRSSLVKRCGRDFQFDLNAWHNYLSSDPIQSYGYRLTGYETVRKSVLSMVDDAWRHALISARADNPS